MLHPPTSTRSVWLECGVGGVDRGWYSHSSDWPSASAEEGNGQLWCNVANDGRLRVFQAATPSTRVLLLSTPVIGPVLALRVLPSCRCVITLEEVTEKHSKCERMVRMYRWKRPSVSAISSESMLESPHDLLRLKRDDREIVELSALTLDQPPNTPIFSPSLFAICSTTNILALAHDREIKLYDLRDIFMHIGVGLLDESEDSESFEGSSRSHGEEEEPGSEQPASSQQPALSTSSSTSLSTASNSFASNASTMKRFTVKVYRVLPLVTLYSPFTIRQFDYKQNYLSFASYSECRLLHIQWEKMQVGRLAERERGDIEMDRLRREANMPLLSALLPPSSSSTPSHSNGSSRTSSARHAVQPSPSSASISASVSDDPLELIGRRLFDDQLRALLRDDIFLREISVVMHRRFAAANQIHTIAIVPSVTPRTHVNRKANVSAGQHFSPQSNPHPSFAMPPVSRGVSHSPVLRPLQGPVPALLSSPPTIKQELFGLLGQGLPTQPFTAVPFALDSLAPPSSISPPLGPSASFEHGGVTVQLMDEDEEDSTSQSQLQRLLLRLEELEDENEAAERAPVVAPLNEEELESDVRQVRSVSSASTSNSRPTSPPAAFSSSSRSNGSIYLHMRLLVSTSEECTLYDIESDKKIVTYFFENDLISLTVRSSFLLALTTKGLEIHSLWYSHPMLHYLTLPFNQIEEPLIINGIQCPLRMQDMIVLDDSIIFRPSPYQQSGSGDKSSSAHSLLSSSPMPQLIVPTDEVDACESWTSWPTRAMPTVMQLVTHIVAQATKSMKSSTEATPSSIRLFTEALLITIQRYSQLSLMVEEHRALLDACNASASIGEEVPFGGTLLKVAQKIHQEFLAVSALLSNINSYLAHIFLTAQEVGLSCYFFFYQHEVGLEQLWQQLTAALKSSTASTSATTYVTKFLIKLLLRPTFFEQSLLLNSPALIQSFLDHLGRHAPHILGYMILKTFLLYCPYDPKQVLRILEENHAKANYETSNASVGQSMSASYRASKTTSYVGTPTSQTPGLHPQNSNQQQQASGYATAYRVRPVVFHTFVQALMHLQLNTCSTPNPANNNNITSPGAPAPPTPSTPGLASPSAGPISSSGKDSAAILLNSFSSHSLEFLLITYSSLLTTWSHRQLLIDFLRASAPWSLLEVLVVLTQRGEIHVHTGVSLITGASQAVAAASTAALAGIASPSLGTRKSSALSLTAPPSYSAQLQAYLESSLNPFMLTQEIGHVLETQHDETILPWDSSADLQTYLGVAAAPTAPMSSTHKSASVSNLSALASPTSPSGLGAPLPSYDDDVPNATNKFVPLHIRENHKFNPYQVILSHTSASNAPCITRTQIASLAAQLACFYLQQELAEINSGASSASRNSVSGPAASSNSTSPQSNSTSFSSPPSRRSVSLSMSMSLAPAVEFSTRHALSNWWRAGWIDTVACLDKTVAISLNNANSGEPVRMKEYSPRMKRIQALLSGPLTLSKKHCLQIFNLIKLLPDDVTRATAAEAGSDENNSKLGIPNKLSLLLLLLPRIGGLTQSLRLLVSSSPETMWTYAQIYCGESLSTQIVSNNSAGGTVSSSVLSANASVPSLAASTTCILKHWQLLHAVVLLHVYYSAHSTEILQTFARELKHKQMDPALADKTDENTARNLIHALLPPYLVTQLLAPFEEAVNSNNRLNYCGAMSHLLPYDRAALYSQLYVYTLDELVQRYHPVEFLSFISPMGSANFYMPYVKKSFNLFQAKQAEVKQKDQRNWLSPTHANEQETQVLSS